MKARGTRIEQYRASSDATLSERLGQLDDAGPVDRNRYTEIPPRVEYSPTATDRELEAHIQALLG